MKVGKLVHKMYHVYSITANTAVIGYKNKRGALTTATVSAKKFIKACNKAGKDLIKHVNPDLAEDSHIFTRGYL